MHFGGIQIFRPSKYVILLNMPLFLISINFAYFSNTMLHGRRTLQTETAKGKLADLFGLIHTREKRIGEVEG